MPHFTFFTFFPYLAVQMDRHWFAIFEAPIGATQWLYSWATSHLPPPKNHFFQFFHENFFSTLWPISPKKLQIFFWLSSSLIEGMVVYRLGNFKENRRKRFWEKLIFLNIWYNFHPYFRSESHTRRSRTALVSKAILFSAKRSIWKLH